MREANDGSRAEILLVEDSPSDTELTLEALRDFKVRNHVSVVEDGVLPANHADVAGAVIGSAGCDWASSHSTILPGALCDNFTSFGGVMSAGAGQTPFSEFLRYGAAGASGTVTEPYAIAAKFPAASCPTGKTWSRMACLWPGWR